MTRKVRIGTGVLAAIVTAAPFALRASGQDATPVPAAAPASAPVQVPVTPEQVNQVIQADVSRLTAALLNSGSKSSPDQREQAAERLLSYRNPDGSPNTDATRVVLQASRSSGPPSLDVRRAIARALVALPEAPDEQFLDPLRGLLADDPQDAAAALARYAGTPQGPRALDTLIDFARNSRVTAFSRAPAVAAIGAFGDRAAAQFLIDLLRNPAEHEDLRNAAEDGLITLTGYEQNGRDPDRWLNWWQVASARPANEWVATVPQAARAFGLARKGDEQANQMVSLLKDTYQSFTNDPKRQETLELSWLRSAQPTVRAGAAGIINQQIQVNRQPSGDVIDQLRSMVSDASPEVRRLVVNTLNNSSDAASTSLLIAQLTVENDPEVKRQIALALGKFHQVASIPWLLKLLDDPNPRVFTAAADALKAQDFVAVIRRDPTALQQVIEGVHQRIDAMPNERSPAMSERYAALLYLAATLGDQTLLGNYMRALGDTKEPVKVRLAGADGLGAITGRDSDRAAQALVGALGDDDKNVRFEAVRELAKVGSLNAVRQAVLNLTNPGVERDNSVREAAWQTLLEVAAKPDVSARNAIDLADAAGRAPANAPPELKRLVSQRRVAMLEVAVPKMQAAIKRPGANVADQAVQLADLYQNIGDEYYNLSAFDRARTNYSQAFDLRQQQGANPPQVIASLTEKIEKSYLMAGRYQEAIAFASKRAQTGADEKATMSSLIRNEVDRLFTAGKLTEANQLADLALQKMDPPLESYMVQQLRDYQRQINERLSSQNKQGAAPVSVGGQSFSAGAR